MTNRKLIFFAGPSCLPLEVLQQLQADLVDYKGNGISMLETSHRGQMFNDMYQECISDLRKIMGIPDDYDAYFLGGGGTLQFGMVPINFLADGKTADYCRTGSWSDKAVKDAKKVGNVNLVFDGEQSKFTTLPDPKTLTPSKDAAYLYLCSNETIGGVEWQEFPDTGDVPLVADMSSDLLSRPVDVSKFSLIFGGVQKNLGPAGATLVVVRKSFLEKRRANLPAYLDYGVHSKGNGLYNTPPVFSIWAIKLVLDWIQKHGGAEGMLKRAIKKSSMLYGVIDKNKEFFRAPVDPRYRSRMNVVFRLPNEELEKKFVEESKAHGMLGLKGHRSVGGLRASIYNAVPVEAVQSLCDFMEEFAKKNG